MTEQPFEIVISKKTKRKNNKQKKINNDIQPTLDIKQFYRYGAGGDLTFINKHKNKLLEFQPDEIKYLIKELEDKIYGDVIYWSDDEIVNDRKTSIEKVIDRIEDITNIHVSKPKLNIQHFSVCCDTK